MRRLFAFVVLFYCINNAVAQVSLKHATGNTSQYGKSIFARQPDGKLIWFTATGGNFYSGRLFANGNNDDAYNGARTSREKLGHLANCKTLAVTLDKWNRVLVAGSSCKDSTNAKVATLTRFTRSGDPDEEFAPGVVHLKVGDSSEFSGVYLLPDEKIMTVGSCFSDGAYRFFLYKLQYNGEKETGTGFGEPFIDNSMPGSNRVAATVAQPDGKIVVVGCNSSGDTEGIMMARYFPSGTKDNMFGTGGATLTGPGGYGYLRPKKIALQSDGKILVAGVCAGESGGQDIFVARYTQWGVLDTSFVHTGILRQDVAYEDRLDDMLVLPDDRIVLSGAGNKKGETKYTRDILLRFSDDGARDELYGYGPGDSKGLSATFSKKGYTGLSHNIVLSEGEWKMYRLSEMVTDDQVETLLLLNTLLLDTSLGVIDVPNRKMQANIYPEPVKSSITFSFDLVDSQKVSVKLLDETGKEVLTVVNDKPGIEGENTVTVRFPATAKPGFYSMVLTTSEGYKQTIELVKR